jgi:hypothetical protein
MIHGSALAYQAQDPEFKSQFHQKTKQTNKKTYKIDSYY